ncbi:hypothetical protein L9F63_001015, partial [Diploptera punctata]
LKLPTLIKEVQRITELQKYAFFILALLVLLEIYCCIVLTTLQFPITNCYRNIFKTARSVYKGRNKVHINEGKVAVKKKYHCKRLQDTSGEKCDNVTSAEMKVFQNVFPTKVVCRIDRTYNSKIMGFIFPFLFLNKHVGCYHLAPTHREESALLHSAFIIMALV